MKKKTTLFSAALFGSMMVVGAQVTETFESFTLAPNSFYKDTTSKPFSGIALKFNHQESKYGNTWYWTGGFSYTNKYDSSTAGPSNLYGVKPYKGYNNSNTYCVGQMDAILVLKSPYNKLDGFYITNTTYAYKSMRYGDAFAKKFGGPSGNDPDFFKVTVRAYLGGTLKNDSVEFYLADYRFSNNAQDYIVSTWQWVNTSSLGQADSIVFKMFSSDNGPYGMNTPAFFALDDVTASQVTSVNENTLSSTENVYLYPNPAKEKVYFTFSGGFMPDEIIIRDITGREIEKIHQHATYADVQNYSPGIYFVEIRKGSQKQVLRFMKNE